MPAGEIQSTTLALTDVNSTDEPTYFRTLAPPNGLVRGTNLLAVEIHQRSVNSPDLSFDLELVGISEQTQGLIPRLNIVRYGPEMVIAWPSGYTQWALYTTPALSPASVWSAVAPPAMTTNGFRTLLLEPTGTSGFYELRKLGLCR
jgi:hypothetical protein